MKVPTYVYLNLQIRYIFYIQVDENSQGGLIRQHMQDMSSLDKNKLLFLRRKHKLFKSLAQAPPLLDFDLISAKNDIAKLYEAFLNKENQASQLGYFIKHELKTDLTQCIPAVMQMLWKVMDVRTGSFVSFIAYRLCRKYPAAYWTVVGFISDKISCSHSKTLEQISFLTNLFLYGFSITTQQFVNLLFPTFQQHVLDLLPKYFRLLQSSQFFPFKYKKDFSDSLHLWMQDQVVKLESSYDQLVSMSRRIQQNLIKQIENQAEQLQYIASLQSYETQLYRLSNAMTHLNEQFDGEKYKLKSIFQLKKQCKTFKLSFQYSEYERALYLNSKELKQLKPLKKSEMLRIEENQAFVARIKLCSTIKQCIDLSGFFLQQMNTQHNREEIIQIIINDCYSYNNISYVLKIVREISQFQPSIVEYCCIKGRKICGQSRMNPKYQKLLCEMSRFGLMDQNILLDYCEKILRLENNQVTKQIESILQTLGTMIYYRSLSTHTRINDLFERIQAMIKSKLVHFNIQHLFHLKGLLNYLRNHANKISMAETEDMAQLQIKTNFQFIFKKMEKLLKQNEVKKILDFVAAGIDHQDFLNSYYYASLIKDLNQKAINLQLHQLTFKEIKTSLEQLNSQRSVCWSRFLGELYNYQIINSKKLLQNLTEILQKYQKPNNISSSLKCICAALQTSKYYLKQSQIKRDKKEVICFLLDIKKIVCLSSLDQLLYDQVSQITQYFHPHLSHFNTIEKIYDLIELVEHPQQTYGIYSILDMMHNGADAEEIKNEQKNQTKKRYQQKQRQAEKKWMEKTMKYKEKEGVVDQNHKIYVQKTRQSPSKQSIRTQETREGNVQKKQIKVMGRSRGDKRIKVVTANYSELLE